MFAHMSRQVIGASEAGLGHILYHPLEHALSMASVIVVAGSFLRYILDDELLARRYIQTGLGTAVLDLSATSIWWPRQLATDPGVRFHEIQSASLLHLLASGVLAVAVVILARKRGWLRNIVLLALSSAVSRSSS